MAGVGHSDSSDRVTLSIVVVCFNDGAVLLPCLESIYTGPPRATFEVILVDNGSLDGSIEEAHSRFPDVVIVRAGYNSGYAGGNNIGFRRASGTYVLFLNPDTTIPQGALDQLVHRADRHPRCGAAGPRVLNADGSLQKSCFRSPCLSRFLHETLMLHRIPGCNTMWGGNGYADTDDGGEMEVEVVSGCCLLARRDLLTEIGAFDEEYFIYFEETDLCERIRAHGWRVLYTPAAEVVHLGGATTVKQRTWFRIQFERSRRRFFAKHRGRHSRLPLHAVLFLNLALRSLLGALAFVSTLGRSTALCTNTDIALRTLAWHCGLFKHGPRPS